MPKIVDHDLMRATLMEKAFGLFARKGFHGVSMRDLSQELEVSTGTVYHYFTNKSELFAQMIKHLVQGDIQEVLAQVTEVESPQDRIAVVLNHVAIKETYFHNLLFLLFDFYRDKREAVESDPLAPTASFFSDSLTIYREAIEENLGHLDKGTGQMLISVIIGTLVQRILDPTAMSLETMEPYINSISDLHAKA